MRKKPAVMKLTKNKEYRTPKSLSWERTAEFYGDQMMPMCVSNVKDKPVNLRNENVRDALDQASKRESKWPV